MTDHVRNDAPLETLTRLATLDVDPKRAEAVRLRCHRRLGRRGWRADLARLAAGPVSRTILEPALVVAPSAGYLIEVMSRAMRLSGL